MTSDLIRRLDEILIFMKPYWDFVNCHMVDYLTNKHWNRFVPEELTLEVQNTDNVAKCIEHLFWCKEKPEWVQRNFPNFIEFLNKIENNNLNNFPEILISKEDFYKCFDNEGLNEKHSIKAFMCPKKSHEVETMAEMVNNLTEMYLKKNVSNEIYVVDAGDGKGYLSSFLAMEYGQKVLGIDSEKTNTENAIKRIEKLQRHWSGLNQHAEKEKSGIQFPSNKETEERAKKKCFSTLNYKTESKFITTDINILNLLRNAFPDLAECGSANPAIFLTGLHTCGNLSSTSLRIFQKQENCKILCNIGCCYHLLKEEFADDEFFNNNKIMTENLDVEAGFPMSTFLKKKRVCLGRNARMLASQSIERTRCSRQLPSKSLFYRALLEVLISSKDIQVTNTFRVGKLKKFDTFHDYVNIIFDKENFDISAIQTEQIQSLELQYAADRHYLELFYLLRMTFAPVIESLILLDRLLYLKESGHIESHLLSLFDAIISPRHYAIIALKN